MAQIKMAALAGLTAAGVILVNWFLDLHFITGFFSGWHVASWFN